MSWLDDEIKKIKRDDKYFQDHANERRSLDTILFRRWILAILLIAIMGISTDCWGEVQTKKIVISWVCPECGYDNLEGIRYCPLCGSER